MGLSRRWGVGTVTAGACLVLGLGMAQPLDTRDSVRPRPHPGPLPLVAESRPVTTYQRPAVPLAHPLLSARAASFSTATPIPWMALSAYQRAATVIDAAAPDCHLEWELLAAVGMVESGHGTVGGGGLDEEGVSHPAIVAGAPGHARETLPDSDAGLLDGDPAGDHTVGPMQLLPSAWSVVAVDGDVDGARDPQDVDDAALGMAVLLCGTELDLAKWRNRRRALRSYNDDVDYINTVLAVRREYVEPEVAPDPPPLGTVVSTAAVLTDGAADPDLTAVAIDPTAGSVDVALVDPHPEPEQSGPEPDPTWQAHPHPGTPPTPLTPSTPARPWQPSWSLPVDPGQQPVGR
jgi:hypothetical protein